MHSYRSIDEDDGDVDRALAFLRGDPAHELAGPVASGWRPAPTNLRIAAYAIIAAAIAAVVMSAGLGCSPKPSPPSPSESREPPLARRAN